MSMGTHDQSLTPVGYEQHVSFSGAAVPLKIKDSSYLLLQATGTAVRWRDDGTAPTATVGMQLDANQDFWYTGDPKAIKAIGIDGSSVLNVSGYK